MASTNPLYDDLNALFINCTLKPSPELSHTWRPAATSRCATWCTFIPAAPGPGIVR
jgi:hypothetical protein